MTGGMIIGEYVCVYAYMYICIVSELEKCKLATFLGVVSSFGGRHTRSIL